jgi:hypothetical protein
VAGSVRYALESGSAPEQSFTIPAGTRLTIHVPDAPGVGRGQVGVGAFVTASAPIAAERALYFDTPVAGLPADGAHAAVGAAQAQGEWVFAEGTTQDGFREFLTLANPGSQDTDAKIDFGVEDGPQKSLTVPVAAGRRVTVNVNDVLGPVVGHSTTVKSTFPILAERPLYFDATVAGLGVNGGHVAFGSIPQRDFYFAEGNVLPDFREFLTLANPDASRPAAVTIEYFLSDGSNIIKSTTVPARSRRTVQVFSAADPAGVGTDVSDPVSRGVSVRLHTDAPAGVVAERPMYFVRDFPGIGVVSDGHNTAGAPGLARAWAFAEGTTLPGFDTFITILSPGAAQAATVTYFTDTPSDGPQVRTINLVANSRTTIQVFGPVEQGGLGFVRNGVAFQVAAADPILAERPLYVNGKVGDLPAVDGGTDVIGLAL